MSQRYMGSHNKKGVVEQKLLVFLIVIGTAPHGVGAKTAALSAPFDERRETLILTAADKTARG